MATSPLSPLSAPAVITRIQTVCVTCARGGSRFVGRYRAFLLAPGTLFTLASLLLLLAASVAAPSGLVNPAHARTPLYLAAALLGPVYIWWSALQGIRKRDFTADLPVSLAPAAALAIGQSSAAAVVAVPLVVVRLLGDVVSPRARSAPLGPAP